ncbi:hypothetical protein EB796_010500 [Bugula neritina]|uniref:Uncharacterized protein n=1 Tax=Bugula neritina TaxID=10212 RepID=A0A7J7JZY2_BUGNE|nr:hypothetical protein EB796_010500 [Bugula neritina]
MLHCLQISKTKYKFKFNDQFTLFVCLTLKAVFTALVPAFRSVYVMCLMFVGQGFMEGIAGIGVTCIAIRLGGRKRNGMYLQAVCLGVSIGSICGPFIARPFLSDSTNSHRVRETTWHTDELQMNRTSTILTEVPPILSSNTTSGQLHNTSFGEQPTIPSDLDGEEFTKTHVYFYYIIIGVISCIPATLFCIQYRRSGLPIRNAKPSSSQSDSMSFKDCSAPLSLTLIFMFMLSLLQFGTQQTYSNLITTFSVLGPLHLTETKGVYISSLFWTLLCFGRLAGIWIAKYLSAFQILLIDIVIGIIGAIFLIIFSAQSAAVLWIFTAVLGFAYSTTTGAVFSWAANHLPDDTYVLVVLTMGECAGVLVEPTLVTSLFKLTGPMTLMYIILIGFLAMFLLLVASQLIVVKCGVDGKLQGNTEKSLVEDDDG